MKGNKSYQANDTMDLTGNAAASESKRCRMRKPMQPFALANNSQIREKQVSSVSIIAVNSQHDSSVLPT